MAQAEETCPCGAKFNQSTNEAFAASWLSGAVREFREAHKACREAWQASLSTPPTVPPVSDGENGEGRR